MTICPACGEAHGIEGCRREVAERTTLTAGAPGIARSGIAIPLPEVLAGRYRILERIGQGGMGEVFRAQDLKLETQVALKLLPAELEGDPERLALLLNEVRVARQVSHPNVCRVYDVAESDGRHFLTMELIEGETLAARLARRGRPTPGEALSIARQTALGLAAAHERGVLHRDLKPGNVMLDDRGVARVTDFGLAVAAPAVEGGKAREGTPPYMAPEALSGGRVTARSDLYSLGLVLQELLPAARPRVAEIVRRCLETDPDRRPASARAVAEALPGGEGTIAGLRAAQRRADRIAAFREEMRELRAAGIVRIDPEEDERIAAHHGGILLDLVRDFDVDVGEQEKQLSLGMRVVSLLGSIALAASAFYFFYRIWGLLSFPAQFAVLAGAPLLGVALVSLVSARDRSGHFTSMAAAFAFAAFVADLQVFGAVVNARPTPTAFLAWGAFALVLAYGYRLRLPLAAGLACLGAYAAAIPSTAMGLDWLEFMGRPEGAIPVGLAVFAAPFFGAARRYSPFAPIYRLIGAIFVLWPMLLLSLAGAGSLLPLLPSSAALLYQWLGPLVAVGAVALGVSRRYRETVHCGFAFCVAHLYIRCFDWWWSWMPRYLFFLILAALAVVVLQILKRLRSMIAGFEEVARP